MAGRGGGEVVLIMKTAPAPLPTIQQILDEHVTLTVERLDRLYLNGYVPTLQTGAATSACSWHASTSACSGQA